jgi:serine/threonine protein kinase
MSSLLEEGSYGCAFTPALPCKQNKKRQGRTVGKVMKAKYADLELEVVPLIEAIPGWKRYFILQDEANCSVKNFAEIRKTYERNCKVIHDAADINLIQLISPYGGRTLFDTPIDTSFDFLENLKHVLEGVTLMQAQGICHYDIKDNNILVDSAGTLRLIDFGQSFLGDQVTDADIKRHQYDFDPSYWPQSPEMSIQNAIHNKRQLSIAIPETIQRKSTFKLMENILGVSKLHAEDELRNFWNGQEEYVNGSWVPFYKVYWRTWDAWSVGAVFLRILQKCFLQKTFVEGVWKQYGILIRHVLKGLLETDPRKRLLPAGALALLRGSPPATS